MAGKKHNLALVFLCPEEREREGGKRERKRGREGEGGRKREREGEREQELRVGARLRARKGKGKRKREDKSTGDYISKPPRPGEKSANYTVLYRKEGWSMYVVNNPWG